MLGDLGGRRFLDIGSGSGLFSLAARNLGAVVHSFDYDPESVACTVELRRRYYPQDAEWTVERGSALDGEYLRALGSYDVVYSWGVLHHTGAMWRALEMATIPLADSGNLYIALYNRLPELVHRPVVARKWLYNRVPPLRPLLVGGYVAWSVSLEFAAALYRWRDPLRHFRSYALTSRGMSWFRDVVDWVGGYPYEAATPAEVIQFYTARGLSLACLKTAIGHGCNEFLFQHVAADEAAVH